jgi:SLOG cluster3 family
MSDSQIKVESRLHGVSIFLSASVPTRERSNEYERIDEAPLQIEEAVVCFARAIFMEGGTLVFGAHPSISPLVAQVIDHYYLPLPGEGFSREPERLLDTPRWQNPSLLIYQSRVWQKYWAEATERLTRHPLVSVQWIDAEPGESVDPDIKNRSQAPLSMELMRRAMIAETSPVAMIAIGGMKGIFDEARIFAELRPQQPIFTLSTTGGAAALLPHRPEYRTRVRVMDLEAERLVRTFWAQQDRQEHFSPEGAETSRAAYVPYAFLAQKIVAEIVEGSRGYLEQSES